MLRSTLRCLLAATALFCLALPARAQQAGSPFQQYTSTYVFGATSSAGTALQIAPTGGVTNYGVYLVSNVGTNGAWVTFASTSAGAAQTVPSLGTPGNAMWVEAGTSRTFTGPNQAWFNAQTATSTTTLYVTGGAGTLTGVTVTGAGGGVSTVSANQGTPNSAANAWPTIGAASATTNSSGTITTGGTFQTLASSSTTRKSLEFQNKSTADNCYLFFGSGTATTAHSITVPPLSEYLRAVGALPSDQVQATCDTTADVFYFSVQ